MTITRYNPFEINDFTNRVFADTMGRLMTTEPSARPWSPAVDVFETENEVVLKADLPEVKLEDVDIRIENGTLTLRGERRFEASTDGKGYHRLERGYGEFARVFTVPDTIDPEKVKAEYKLGALTVTLPKKDVAKPRSIKVEVAA